MYRIMIVEDDEIIAKTVKKQADNWGYETFCIEDFANVMADFVEFAPHLVLLDISLPIYNGYHWCSEIRKLSKIPIMFISSSADNMNIVMAMNQGADDFVAKPFDLMVLISKIQALLRRSYDFSGQSHLLEHRGLLLDKDSFVGLYQGNRVELTKNEGRILALLMEQNGKVISREIIMKRLWETDSFIDDNTLTVNMTRLKKKLESVGITDFIMTQKGVGYVIR